MKIIGKKNGFTLIEIVVVIAIMGILTAIVYSSFDASKAQSRDQQRVSDIGSIQLSLEQYFYKNGVYPTKLIELVPTYMSSLPTPPLSTDETYDKTYFPMTKTSGSSNCISYQLWTQFEQNSSYLDSKRGFNSTSLPSSLSECGNLHMKINASDQLNSKIYDVMP